MTDSPSPSPSRLTYLVVGGTGKQGRACINALLADPTPKIIRFLTRNSTSAASLKLTQLDSSINAYQGDLLDPASLERALDGVQRAFLVTDPLGGVDKEVTQGINFIEAAKKMGTEHIVFTSVCDADKATMVPHFDSKWKIEQHLEASGIPYTITRPVAFFDNFGAAPGIYRFIALGAFFSMSNWATNQFISVTDIGIVAAKALLSPSSPEFKNKRIDLSAGSYTIYDSLRAYEKVQGVKPWYASLWPTWLVYALPHDFKQMMLYFRKAGYPKVDIEGLRKIHPGLQSFEDYIAANSTSKKVQ